MSKIHVSISLLYFCQALATAMFRCMGTCIRFTNILTFTSCMSRVPLTHLYSFGVLVYGLHSCQICVTCFLALEKPRFETAGRHQRSNNLCPVRSARKRKEISHKLGKQTLTILHLLLTLTTLLMLHPTQAGAARLWENGSCLPLMKTTIFMTTLLLTNQECRLIGVCTGVNY